MSGELPIPRARFGDMPKPLQEFLQALPADVAEEVWLWLDSNPAGVDEMVEVICAANQWGGYYKSED
jgi:hypothetical protein